MSRPIEGTNACGVIRCESGQAIQKGPVTGGQGLVDGAGGWIDGGGKRPLVQGTTSRGLAVCVEGSLGRTKSAGLVSRT